MEKKLSRRSFLAGAGLLGATMGFGLAGCSSAEPAAPAEDTLATTGEDATNGIVWAREADVVVLGYGAAGAATAIEAADNGASVLIVEKEALPGGSMARCGGAIMGAGTRVQKELGYEDAADDMYDWIMTCTDGACPDYIARTYADRCGANVDWLEDLSKEHTDQDLFEYARAAGGTGATSGSSGGAGCLDATGCDYEKFGISKETALPRTHWAKAIPDNTANSGPELFLPLYEAINARADQIESVFDTAFVRFVMNDEGAVIGVEVEGANGAEYIKANKGVMLATGGFCAGEEMQKKFVPEAVGKKCYMSDACVGEGIKAAMAIGADLTQMSYYYPIAKAQQYHYNVQYNDVFYSWDMDDEGYMEVPEDNMAETHGGVVINDKAQVLDVWGEVIPGLYAAGNDVGSNIFGKPGNYPGCGCYVSFAVCFGRIAGEEMAKA
ncbi:FAD-dependent oxidoreductase [Eggerthellaceae bacterium 3-80]|nr:FAD-dependent oxidoreductase [bacterium D16-34]